MRLQLWFTLAPLRRYCGTIETAWVGYIPQKGGSKVRNASRRLVETALITRTLPCEHWNITKVDTLFCNVPHCQFDEAAGYSS
jgi:hypothetical protein